MKRIEEKCSTSILVATWSIESALAVPTTSMLGSIGWKSDNRIGWMVFTGWMGVSIEMPLTASVKREARATEIA